IVFLINDVPTSHFSDSGSVFLLNFNFFHSFVHVFVLRGRRVYSLCQQAGTKSSGEYKRHQFRRSERYFL
ncbi:TPA: hypothetical protein ACP60F_004889, partial [Escherichia coli]